MTKPTQTFLVFALVSGVLFAQPEERLASSLKALCAVKGLRREHSLKVSRTHTDDKATIHHLQQYYHGIKVWGAITNVREDDEQASVVAKQVFSDIDISIEPSLSVTEARSIVERQLRRQQPSRYRGLHRRRLDNDMDAMNSSTIEHSRSVKIRHLSEPEVELVIFPVEEQRILPTAAHKSAQQLNAEDVSYVITGYRLAYHVATDVDVKGNQEQMNYLVDAHSGEVIREWNEVSSIVAAGTVNTKYRGTVPLYTNQNGSTYEAKDPIYCNNYVSNSMSSKIPYKDDDNVWGNGGNYADGTPDAIQTGVAEALYGLQRACQMHKAVWSRNGSSGAGIAIKVAWGQFKASDTAVNSKSNYMVVGYEDNDLKDMTTLDIIGHEYGHNMDYWYSRLCEDKTGEGGGLAEAHADIMGLLTEVYGKYTPNDPNNPATTIPEVGLTDPNTWILGEDVAKSKLNEGKGLRFFIKPSWNTDGGSIDAWTSEMADVEVHAAAGPTDRMFYYLAVGAPSDPADPGYTTYLPNGSMGIGLHKAALIWVKAMTSGLLSSNSKHINARNACISAATKLYGANSPEVASVMNAWAGVNVGQTAGVVSVSPSYTAMPSGVSQLFTATVTGAANNDVIWTCTGGTVDQNGNFTAPYVSSNTFITVRATSVAESTRYQEATISVSPATIVTYNEVESNDSLTTANVVADNITELSGEISSTTDLDFFKINVAAGRTVLVNMTDPTITDFDFYLLTKEGTVLSSTDSSASVKSITYLNNSTKSAVYYLKVLRCSDSSSTNPYKLTVLR